MHLIWSVVVILLSGVAITLAQDQLTCEQQLTLAQKQLAVTRQSRAQMEQDYAALLVRIEAAQKQAQVPAAKVEEKPAPKGDEKKK